MPKATSARFVAGRTYEVVVGHRAIQQREVFTQEDYSGTCAQIRAVDYKRDIRSRKDVLECIKSFFQRSQRVHCACIVSALSACAGLDSAAERAQKVDMSSLQRINAGLGVEQDCAGGEEEVLAIA